MPLSERTCRWGCTGLGGYGQLSTVGRGDDLAASPIDCDVQLSSRRLRDAGSVEMPSGTRNRSGCPYRDGVPRGTWRCLHPYRQLRGTESEVCPSPVSWESGSEGRDDVTQCLSPVFSESRRLLRLPLRRPFPSNDLDGQRNEQRNIYGFSDPSHRMSACRFLVPTHLGHEVCGEQVRPKDNQHQQGDRQKPAQPAVIARCSARSIGRPNA